MKTAWRIEASVPAKMYHLTTKVDFKLDPKKRPENNTTLGGSMPPGIFLGASVESWVNGYGYWRPWVVCFNVPTNADTFEGAVGGYSGELYVPAAFYDRLRIERVIPLDAWCREEYGSWGWVEEDDGLTFDTEQPITAVPDTFHATSWDQIYPWKGYRYPGDARQTDPAWQARYKKRVAKYGRSHPGAIA